MSAPDIVWLSPRYTDVDGTSNPGSYTSATGEQNRVAAIRIVSQLDGRGVIIHGRPEDLVAQAREILRTAELIVEQTMRDPELRSLYGITS